MRFVSLFLNNQYVIILMKQNKGVKASRAAPILSFRLRSLSALTLFRIAFGIVWLVDGSMKFLWPQPSDVVTLVQKAGSMSTSMYQLYWMLRAPLVRR